jgi:hypothetical protein
LAKKNRYRIKGFHTREFASIFVQEKVFGNKSAGCLSELKSATWALRIKLDVPIGVAYARQDETPSF